MSEQKKPAKLSHLQQIDNIYFRMAIVANGVIAIVWTVQMWLRSYHRWHKKHPAQWFRPQLPKVITVWVIGDEPQTPYLYHLMAAYHVRFFRFSYQWTIQDNHVGLTLQLLINPSMYDQVDSILFNGANGLWEVQSKTGTLRHVQFRPHDQVGQERQQQAQRPAQPARKPTKAKLGKSYQRG